MSGGSGSGTPAIVPATTAESAVAKLLAQLEALKTAYRSGAQSIQYEGKSISYRDGNEMRAAIRSLENELGISSSPRSVVVRSRKGW